MGFDPNANLWFGFIPREEYVAPWQGEEWEWDIEDYWTFEVNKKTFEKGSDAHQRWLAVHPCPIEEIPIGTTDEESFYTGFALRNFSYDTCQGVAIDIDINEYDPDIIEEELFEACEKMGIPIPRQKIGWKLTAYYG